MNSNKKYDVVIIGAGPAGATAARLLTQAGCCVLIIEGKKLPRYKTCSGLIMGRSQKLIDQYFGPLPDAVFCNEKHITGARLCPSGKKLIDMPFDTDQTYNVWRSKFDYHLTSMSGADILDEHKCIGFQQKGDLVELTLRKPDETSITVITPCVIGADGGNSWTRRTLQPELEKSVSKFAVRQLYCSGTVDLDPDYYHLFFDPSLTSLYTWLNFKDGLIVFGVSTKKGVKLSQSLTLSTDYLKDNFNLQINEIKRKSGCVVTDMSMTNTFCFGKGSILLAGEAAGFLNLFGEGISSALATGAIAAQAILNKEKSKESLVTTYNEMLKEEQKETVNSWELAEKILGKDLLK